MSKRRFVPTNQQVSSQRQLIAHLSFKQMEQDLIRRGCRWVDIAAPPEGFYGETDGDVPSNWIKARSIKRGDQVVGHMENSSEYSLRSILAHVMAQDEFKDRNDWPPGMEPPTDHVPDPWQDVCEGRRWLRGYYQGVVSFDERPDPTPSFEDMMYLVELWKERRDGARDDHILLEEFEVEAFPESDEKMSWSSGFYFTKALRSPDDRIIWPGDQTWIDAPVKRVGFFFIPERFWQQYLQRDSTDNPPKVDLKWPWKRHDGVDVD